MYKENEIMSLEWMVCFVKNSKALIEISLNQIPLFLAKHEFKEFYQSFGFLKL